MNTLKIWEGNQYVEIILNHNIPLGNSQTTSLIVQIYGFGSVIHFP